MCGRHKGLTLQTLNEECHVSLPGDRGAIVPIVRVVKPRLPFSKASRAEGRRIKRSRFPVNDPFGQALTNRRTRPERRPAIIRHVEQALVLRHFVDDRPHARTHHQNTGPVAPYRTELHHREADDQLLPAKLDVVLIECLRVLLWILIYPNAAFGADECAVAIDGTKPGVIEVIDVGRVVGRAVERPAKEGNARQH